MVTSVYDWKILECDDKLKKKTTQQEQQQKKNPNQTNKLNVA